MFPQMLSPFDTIFVLIVEVLEVETIGSEVVFSDNHCASLLDAASDDEFQDSMSNLMAGYR